MIEERLLTAKDGATSTLRIHPGDDAAPVIVCFPAMGVPARFYDRFGAALARLGPSLVVTELRGVGTSSVRPGRGVDFGYWTMLEQDWPAALVAAAERFPGPRFVLGHSLGGQLSVLSAGLGHDVRGLITIASCSIDWRGFGAYGPAILAFTQASSALAGLLGYYPGEQIGFGGRAARGVIRDWSYQGRTGRYAPVGAPFDLEARLAEVELPVLGVSIAGDSWAPVAAVDRLMAKLPKARLERLHHEPVASIPGRPHFTWAKGPEKIAAEITRFVTSAARP